MLTLDRGRRFPLRRALAAPAAASLTLEQEQYYPDSLGDLYGRVTELLGFDPDADEHKVQWLSAVRRSTGSPDLFLEILGGRKGRGRASTALSSTRERLGHGGFSAKFYERLGLADGARFPAP